jgi:hypothetical protein
MASDKLFEEIMLDHPPPLRIEHTKVAVDDIDFDHDNPRLRYIRSLHPDKTDTEYLFMHNDTKWLKTDIKEKGLLDAPYVKKAGARYICIEGNRRLACVKSLAGDDPRFKQIPVRVVPEITTNRQTALLMASFHVAGKLQWQAHEKAGHIYRMVHELNIPVEELKSTLHMGKPAIDRAAESYRILKDVFCKIDDGKYKDDAEGKWSFFAGMLADKDLRKIYHEADPYWCERFARWVGEGRIPSAVDVRDLAEILAQARARHLFETSPVGDAWRLARGETDTNNPANMSRFYKTLRTLLDTLMTAEFKDIELAGSNQAAKLLLQDTYTKLGDFMDKSGVRIPPAPRRAA